MGKRWAVQRGWSILHKSLFHRLQRMPKTDLVLRFRPNTRESFNFGHFLVCNGELDVGEIGLEEMKEISQNESLRSRLSRSISAACEKEAKWDSLAIHFGQDCC